MAEPEFDSPQVGGARFVFVAFNRIRGKPISFCDRNERQSMKPTCDDPHLLDIGFEVDCLWLVGRPDREVGRDFEISEEGRCNFARKYDRKFPLAIQNAEDEEIYLCQPAFICWQRSSDIVSYIPLLSGRTAEEVGNARNGPEHEAPDCLRDFSDKRSHRTPPYGGRDAHFPAEGSPLTSAKVTRFAAPYLRA